MDLMSKVMHISFGGGSKEAQNSQDWTLQEGDIVLVLLPTSSDKLSALQGGDNGWEGKLCH